MKPASNEEQRGGEAAREDPMEREGRIEELVRERDEYLENWKRARADYQNLRRRLQSDIDAAVSKARAGLLSELLLVVDSLEMALEIECATEEGRNLKRGVEMTHRQLLQILEQQDVRPVPDGGRFDPALHQAVDFVPALDHESGAVIETVRRGWRMGEHVLRHAQVKVAAAPSRGSRGDAAASSSSDDDAAPRDRTSD